MSRKKAKGAGSRNGPAESASTVVSGSIRSADERDSLKVELDFSGGRVTMHADGKEIGAWPSEAVSVDPIDSVTFSFVAEGDRLIFLPDDPGAFGIVPLVEMGDTPGGKRPRRRPKKKAAEGTQVEATKKEKKRVPKLSRKTSREHRKAASRAPSADRADTTTVANITPPAVESVTEQDAPSRAGLGDDPSKEKRTRLWIRTLDTARRHDFFGLDRVQIDEDLRGQIHEHTWDDRVAPKAGPGKHICTICGRIRR